VSKLLWAAAILAVLLVGAALAVPSLIDWNAYRGEVAGRVEAAIGRPITIDGDLRLRLLPAPTLSVGKVRVANPPDMPGDDMATVEALSIELALRPLLIGEIEAANIVLMHPILRLERGADDRVNWAFEPHGRSADESVGDHGIDVAPSASGGGGTPVRLDQVRIENGEIEYRDAARGRHDRIERIHADFSAGTLAGPFKGNGDLVANGRLLSFALSLGRIGEGKTAPMSLNVTLPTAQLAFAGTLADGQRATGTLRLAGPDLAGFVAAASDVAGADVSEIEGLHRAFAAEARLDATLDAIRLDDLQLEIDGIRAAGAAGIAFRGRPRGDIALSAQFVDLDRWLVAGRDARGGKGQAETARTGAEAPGATGAMPPTPAIPEGIDLDIDMSASTIVYRGDAIQDARLAVTLDRAQLSVEATANLPGVATARIAGTATPGTPFPRFDGEFSAGADNLRGLLDWLDLTPRGVAGDRLRTFKLSGRLAGDGKTLQATGLDLRLDTTSASGGLALALIDRLSFGLSVAADEFDLDAYRPRPETSPMEAAQPADTTPAADESGGPASRLRDALGRFDANIQARIGRVDWNGTPVRDLRVNAVLYRGRLDVREFRVSDMAGATGSLVGEIFPDDAGGGFGINAQIDATAASLPRLLAALDIPPPAGFARAAGASIKGSIAGTAAAADLDLRIGIGRMAARFTGRTLDLGPALRYDGRIEVGGPRIKELLELVSPGYAAAGPSGPFEIGGDFHGGVADLSVADMTIGVAGQQVSGIATVRWDGPRPTVGARLTGGTIAADALFGLASEGGRAGDTAGSGTGGRAAATEARPPADDRWSTEPLDLGVLRAIDADAEMEAESLTWKDWRVVQPRLSVALEDGLFVLRHLEGRMFDGAFAMTGRIAAAETDTVPRIEARLTIDGARIAEALFEAGDVAVVEGTLDYTLDLTAAGASELALVRSLGGNGRLDVRDGRLRGFDMRRIGDGVARLARPADLLRLAETALAGGSTRFERLAGSFAIAEGVVRSDDLTLAGDGLTGDATLVADLPKWRIDMPIVFRLADRPDTPPLGVRIEGPLDQPRRKIDTGPIKTWALEQGAGRVIDRLLGPSDEGTAAGDGATGPRAEDTAEEMLRRLLKR